ncbi:hypothetical protein [Tropicimonas sediminicola]|uniref:Uncharacterized protein n=1 Tax=Tropicimonas sediminicola TaxID=1031541 RepID=A0A239LCV9_9RHOB|nr:hypothetical protein [Tropicimonas sediminicola]SNT28301.1 hypothetical protein SAMN05421757_109146 [Tropicimonas sediminicola]
MGIWVDMVGDDISAILSADQARQIDGMSLSFGRVSTPQVRGTASGAVRSIPGNITIEPAGTHRRGRGIVVQRSPDRSIAPIARNPDAPAVGSLCLGALEARP